MAEGGRKLLKNIEENERMALGQFSLMPFRGKKVDSVGAHQADDIPTKFPKPLAIANFG